MNASSEGPILHEQMPNPQQTTRHEIEVQATAEQVYAAVSACNLGRSAIVRLLFRLRRIPSQAVTIAGLQEIGFRLIGARDDNELALGLIGSFWNPWLHGPITDFADFKTFDTPGYAKAACNFLVQPITKERTLLSTETRIRCTSAGSRFCFACYWMIIKPFSGLVRREWLRLIKEHAETQPGS